MNVVTPYAKLLDVQTKADGVLLLKKIEWAGRISHRSEEAQTKESYEKFMRAVVLGHGDWSIVEHAVVSVDFYVDRGITHEIVRHRLFSFTQESTRFVHYEKKMPPSFIYPKAGAENLDPQWFLAIECCESVYKNLLAKGWTPQEARSVFPNALGSRIIMTGNLRNWRHFPLMRTTREAHPQMRQVTIPLLRDFQERIPIIFEDIEPEAKQADNLKKMR